MTFSPHQNQRKVYMQTSRFLSIEQPVISQSIGVDFSPEKIRFLLDVIFWTKGIKLIDQKVEANLNQEVSALKYRQQKKVSAKTATFHKRRLFD